MNTQQWSIVKTKKSSKPAFGLPETPHSYVSHNSGHLEWTEKRGEALWMKEKEVDDLLRFLNGLAGSPGYEAEVIAEFHYSSPGETETLDDDVEAGTSSALARSLARSLATACQSLHPTREDFNIFDQAIEEGRQKGLEEGRCNGLEEAAAFIVSYSDEHGTTYPMFQAALATELRDRVKKSEKERSE